MVTKVIDIEKLYVRYNGGFWDIVAINHMTNHVTIQRGEDNRNVRIDLVEFHLEDDAWKRGE